MKFELQATQRAVRIELFRLVGASVPTGTAAQDATGCPEGTYRCTVLKNATGDFTINYNEPFTRVPVVTATALHASSKLYASLSTSTTSAVRVLCYTDAGTLTDPTSLCVNASGFDTADQT